MTLIETAGAATTAELADLADRIAGWARDGEQLEAYVARGRHTSVKAYGGDVESFSSAQSEGVGIRVIANQRQGFAYAASLDPAVIEETVAEARDNAQFGEVDEFLGLVEPDGVPAVELELFRPSLAEFPTDRKVAMALELERATKAADPRIKGVESADYGDSQYESAVATSNGIRTSSRRTVCSIWAGAMADDGSGGPNAVQTGGGYSVARTPEDLDVEKAATEAAWRATRLLGAVKPASQKLTVVLEPKVTSSFLGIVSGILSGMSAIKGRSLFAGRLGETVAAPFFTFIDDPTEPQAYGASPYDAEGLASRPNVLIEDGVLTSFLHNAYTARRSGIGRSTANAVRGGFKGGPGVGSRAITLVPGDRDQEQILGDIGEGVLIQSVTGLHSGVNATTGDFSVGIQGLMIRNGAIAEPVREATIASTLQRMLCDIVAIGSDREWLPGGAAGVTLAIGDVTLSGS